MRISNTEILKELGNNIFITRPDCTETDAPWTPSLKDFDATNLNLHLGAPLLLWPMDLEYVVDRRAEHIAKAWEKYGKRVDLSGGKTYTLRKNEKCLAFTQEHIRLPVGRDNLCTRLLSSIIGPHKGSRSYLGHLSNRSWAGRSFIRSAVDAFEVKPGTDNHVTLEIISDFDIELYEGMDFIQIGFERVVGEVFETHGWVHGQTTPSGGQTPRQACFETDILALHEAARKRLTGNTPQNQGDSLRALEGIANHSKTRKKTQGNNHEKQNTSTTRYPGYHHRGGTRLETQSGDVTANRRSYRNRSGRQS